MNVNQKKPRVNIEDVSILAWLLKNQIKSEKGDVLDFSDRLFLLPILCDFTPRQVWKKCSQVGGSVVYTIKCLFALLKYGFNIIYTHPAQADVEEFAKTKTNPIIRENHAAFPGVSTDSVYLKQIGKRNLHLQGTISNAAAISTTADLLVHDEASRSDQQKIAFFQSRLKASEYKGTWMFSNPTTDKDLMDEEWKKSDQKEWYVKCDNGHKEILTWPDSIDREKKCFVCKVCNVEIKDEQRRRGVWVDRDGVVWKGKINPKYEISGWHTSHLMAPWITASDIIKDSEGDQEYFYNFVLGEPYNPGDLKVSASLIRDNWTPRDLSVGKEWFLGVDVGNMKHYCLGTELGVVKVGKFSKWDELDDMMRFYKPTLVIDALPDNTMSRYFVDTYPGAFMWFPQENTNNPQTLVWWGKNESRNVVYTNRNRGLDQFFDEILQAKVLFGFAADKDMREFVDHFLSLRRVKVTNSRGVEVYKWENGGKPDHYVFAAFFYYLARLSRGAGVVFSLSDEEKPELITVDNKVVGSFDDILEAREYADHNN